MSDCPQRPAQPPPQIELVGRGTRSCALRPPGLAGAWGRGCGSGWPAAAGGSGELTQVEHQGTGPYRFPLELHTSRHPSGCAPTTGSSGCLNLGTQNICLALESKTPCAEPSLLANSGYERGTTSALVRYFRRFGFVPGPGLWRAVRRFSTWFCGVLGARQRSADERQN